MSNDWRAGSRISIDDPSLAGVNNFASILVQEAYLTDLVEDPPTDEPSMRLLLAAVYEISEMNIFHEIVEVMAYLRQPGPVMNEPDSVIYKIRYRRARRRSEPKP